MFFKHSVKYPFSKPQLFEMAGRFAFVFHSALTLLGVFMRIEFLFISVLRKASGSRVKLASCKSALNPTVV